MYLFVKCAHFTYTYYMERKGKKGSESIRSRDDVVTNSTESKCLHSLDGTSKVLR